MSEGKAKTRGKGVRFTRGLLWLLEGPTMKQRRRAQIASALFVSLFFVPNLVLRLLWDRPHPGHAAGGLFLSSDDVGRALGQDAYETAYDGYVIIPYTYEFGERVIGLRHCENVRVTIDAPTPNTTTLDPEARQAISDAVARSAAHHIRSIGLAGPIISLPPIQQDPVNLRYTLDHTTQTPIRGGVLASLTYLLLLASLGLHLCWYIVCAWQCRHYQHGLDQLGAQRCPTCDYDLSGTSGSLCPECGTDLNRFTADADRFIRSAGRRPEYNRLKRYPKRPVR